jgi:hypothetical protein
MVFTLYIKFASKAEGLKRLQAGGEAKRRSATIKVAPSLKTPLFTGVFRGACCFESSTSMHLLGSKMSFGM